MAAKAAPARRLISRMSSIDRRAGFTLLEVVAVMLIIALVSSLVIAATPGTGRAGLQAVTLKTATLLRRERMSAILDRKVRRVALDGGRRVLVTDSGTVVAIPSDVTVDVLGADAAWSGRRAVVRFEPDGASSGVVLRFSRERAGYEIRVNWYTGGVSVSASEAP
jgi:general secretion pathway protein H